MHAESVVVVSHALNIAFSLFLSWSSEWQRLRPLFGHSRLLCTGIVRYWFVFYNLLMYIVLSSVFRGWAMAPPRRYTVKNGISNLFQTNCVVTMASPSLKSWLRHWLCWRVPKGQNSCPQLLMVARHCSHVFHFSQLTTLQYNFNPIQHTWEKSLI